MSKAIHFSLGRLLLQIALGCMLSVAGIWTLMGGGDAGVSAIRDVISDSKIETILIIAYGVIELLAGIFLILELFIGDRFGALDQILMIIIMIIWIAAIVLIDFLGNNGILKRRDVLAWIYNFSQHLMVLGALIYLKN